MSLLLDYLSTNNINCRTILEPVNYSNISNINGTFIVRNILNNSIYDFIQSSSSDYPELNNGGLSFINNQNLYCRTNDLLLNLDKYTLIYVVKTKPDMTGNLIQLKKTSGSTILLDYLFDSTNLIQHYSNVNLFDSVLSNLGDTLDNVNPSLEVGVVKHDIKYGISSLNLNTEGIKVYINANKGKLLSDNFSSVLLCSNNAVSSTLYYFILAEDLIEDSLLVNLVDILLTNTFKWEYLDDLMWNSISDSIWNNIMSGVIG